MRCRSRSKASRSKYCAFDHGHRPLAFVARTALIRAADTPRAPRISSAVTLICESTAESWADATAGFHRRVPITTASAKRDALDTPCVITVSENSRYMPLEQERISLPAPVFWHAPCSLKRHSSAPLISSAALNKPATQDLGLALLKLPGGMSCGRC